MIRNILLGREPQGQVWMEREGRGERKLNRFFLFPGMGRRARGERERISPLCGDTDFNGLKRKSGYKGKIVKK